MTPILPFGIVAALVVAVMTARYHNIIQKNRDANATKTNNTATAKRKPTSSTGNSSSTSVLQQARRLEPPEISLMQGGEYEHDEFWGEQGVLIKAAWDEWWNQQAAQLPDLTQDLMDPTLVQVVEQVRQNPTTEKEANIRNLFLPILTDQVYQIPFLSPRGVRWLRQHLDAATFYYNNRTHGNHTVSNVEAAGIPTRRPNGMNRYGIILDPAIEGAVSYEGINTWVKHVVDEYVRPLSRMLFPQLTSRHHPEDDCESYAFTIRYHPDEDMELKEHSDASVYTININLNLNNLDEGKNIKHDGNGSNSTEQYKGSSLYFVDPVTGSQKHVSFTGGMAVLHRGLIRHAALPITQGERHNLVIWLFGKHGDVRFAEYPTSEHLSVTERWGKTKNTRMHFVGREEINH